MSKDKTAEFGDFQTPAALARDLCHLLATSGASPAALLEPTCGRGSILFAGLDQFKSAKTCLAVDINPSYIAEAERIVRSRRDRKRVSLVLADFFAVDWQQVITGLPEPILVLGNLPWVTNAHLSTLGSQNLPAKTNFQNRNGLDAITGKANFDISEWMLINLIEAMNGRHGTLAMLCKSAVARKILYHGWKHGIALERSAIYRIEADLHFDAAVDAALLVLHFAPGRHDLIAKVYKTLNDPIADTIIGFEDGMLLADIAAYDRWKHLCGDEIVKWRSGVKHDCAKVMELYREGSKFRNGLGELVGLEDEFVFPMMKSSHVAKGGKGADNRFMLVTQRTVGEGTATIQDRAPHTWAYLNAHADLLNKRGSSIYRNRPQFSIFGIGRYTFAPWKVAISGFYKKTDFTIVGPVNGKPVVLDDTSYFLPCQTKQQAEYLGSLLNSSTAQSFYRAFIFWDAKRPITADLLRRLDLRRLADEAGSTAEFDTHFDAALLSWPLDRCNSHI
jgi:hypothetical protein